jgi:transaldolase
MRSKISDEIMKKVTPEIMQELRDRATKMVEEARKWTTFCDKSYYEIWVVTDGTQMFHLIHKEEAEKLCEILNESV